jgi:hypothetical protein
MVRPCSGPRQQAKLAGGTKVKEHAMSQKSNCAIAVIGIDIGKNSFHVVGHYRRGAIVLRQKWSRGQVETRLANLPPCLIGMEACVGAHHLSRKLQLLGHDAGEVRAAVFEGLGQASDIPPGCAIPTNPRSCGCRGWSRRGVGMSAIASVVEEMFPLHAQTATRVQREISGAQRPYLAMANLSWSLDRAAQSNWKPTGSGADMPDIPRRSSTYNPKRKLS